MDKAKERPYSVVGGHPPDVTFRVNCHNVQEVKIIEGLLEARPWEEDDGMKRCLFSRKGVGGVEILLILGLVAAAGGWLGLRTRGPKVEKLLEVRPAMGTAVTMPQDLIERIKTVPGVKTVEPYLSVDLVDRTGDFTFSILGGTSFGKLKILKGRGLKAKDAGKRVALVDRIVAEHYAPPGETSLAVGAAFDLLGGVKEAADLALPPGPAEVEVVGIYEGGALPRVLLPLDTAQRLLGLEWHVSGLVITVRSAKLREQVAEELRAALGEEMDVIELSKDRMRHEMPLR